jgi:DNA-directed RNA polymerase subunit K/omega
LVLAGARARERALKKEELVDGAGGHSITTYFHNGLDN